MKYVFVALLLTAASCSNSEKSDKSLESRMARLEKERARLQEIKLTISQLEKEIQEMDPSAIKSNTVLISTFTVAPTPFEHKIEVRGAVQSRKNIQMSAQISGLIDKIYVKEGQQVKTGQLLISIDAEVLRNTIAELKTSLELANTMFKKQADLWEQKIGTEVQYLQAKNNKEALERRLATAYAQLDMTQVKAPFGGTVDEVQAREGELASPGTHLVRVTSPQDMYIQADISEKFIGKFKQGDPVEIYFPAQEKTISSSIKAVGQVINSENRTFTIEVVMPALDFIVKPNQITVLHLRDYYSKASIIIPTRIIQRDSKGEFIFGVESKDGKMVARKIAIVSGLSYESNTEIISGLTGSEQLVDKGFRELADGVEVQLNEAEDATSQVAKK